MIIYRGRRKCNFQLKKMIFHGRNRTRVVKPKLKPEWLNLPDRTLVAYVTFRPRLTTGPVRSFLVLNCFFNKKRPTIKGKWMQKIWPIFWPFLEKVEISDKNPIFLLML